jgi:hypothetical protein
MTKIPDSSYVPWDECQPIINSIRNKTGSSMAEIADACGWSTSYFQSGARDNKVRKSVKYSLLGLLASAQGDKLPINRAQFNFEELTHLFQAVMTEKKRSPGNEALSPLLVKIAKEIAS